MAKSNFSKANSPFGGSLNMKPSALKPAAPQPFTPAPAPPMPQPFDANQELARLQASMNIGLSDAEGTYQTGRTGYQTGYNAAGARDFSNPYSQAQLLEDEYKRSLSGTTNSYAAQGQLNSGAKGRALARDDRLYAQSSAGLRDQAADTYHSIGAGRLQTYASNAAGVNSGAFDSLRRSVYGP